MKTLTLDVKSLIVPVVILALVGMAVRVIGAGAATTGEVAATVTAQLVSVSVTDGDVAYGILSLNTATDTTASGINDSQTATNNGNVTADFGIKSSDAAGGTPWDLVTTVGLLDKFEHEWCTVNCDGTPTWNDFDLDNTTYSSLATSVATSTGQAFDLRINTPTSVTDNDLKTITVTVLATAS